MAKKIVKILKKYWLIPLFILVLLLRLPSIFEPFTYGDEGIYLALGQAARRGLVWYRDIHDNKPPMLYLVAALAGNFSYYRLIYLIWSFITVFVFYQLSRVLFGKNFPAVIITTTTFAFLTNSHTFEGNVANAENFMLLPTITAFLLILRPKRPYKIYFSAGALLSLATLFKVPAAFDFAALCIFLLIIFFEEKKKNYPLYVVRYALLLFGFFLPILLTIIYYATQGALYQYLTAAFFQNLPYLSSWAAEQPQAGGLPLLLLTRALGVFSLIFLIFIFRKRLSLAAKLILIWFAFSWFAALLSSRPYPHYLVQILPPLSLSAGLLFLWKKQYLNEKIIPITLLFVLLATFVTFQFWRYRNRPYYLNFYQYALRQKSQQEYFVHFDSRTNDIYQLASYLQSHNHVSEKIFIWGNIPFIYPLARRLPTGRYTVAYHIIDFNGYQETMEILQAQKPQYIIIDSQEERPFPEFFIWLEQKYALEKQIGEFKLHHRLL